MGREGWVLIVKSHECQKESTKGKMEKQKRHERYKKQKVPERTRQRKKYVSDSMAKAG